MILHSPIFSGSINQAESAYANLSGSFTGSFKGVGDFEGLVADSIDYVNIFNVPTLVSGSSQISYPDISNIPSGIISSSAQIDTLFDIDGLVSGGAQVEFNEVNNNPFSQSASSVSVSKNIVPTSTTIDLGSPAVPFRDLYLSSASLYIDGQQVISSNTNELIITTDVNQSLKLVETGADTITLQTADGNLTFTATGNGVIELDAPIQVAAGNQILSSDGNAIQIGEDISVTGNISVTGTVDSVDVAGLKSDFDTLKGKTLVSGSVQVSYPDLSNIPSGIVSSSAQITPLLPSGVVSGSSQVTPLLPTGVVSGSSQITITESQISDLDHYTDTDFDNRLATKSTSNLSEGSNLYYTDARVKTKLDTDLVVSGSASNVKTFLSLGNVTNESKATMFTSPTFTGTVSGVTATHVGLGSVNNTSDANKPVSTAQATAIGLKANIASPTFTGTVIAPTPADNDNSTKVATTAFVMREVSDLLGGAPAAFDTLLEISASIANGDSDVVALTTVVGGKLQKDQNLSDLANLTTARTNLGLENVTNESKTTMFASPTFTGTVSGVTATHVGLGNVDNTADSAKPVSTAQATAIGLKLAKASNLSDLTNTGTARTNLGVDAAGTDNSTPVTLAGSLDYLTISGQVITRNAIVLTTDVSGVLPSANMDADTAHLSGTQTFSGAKSFSSAVNIDSTTASTTKTTGALIVDGGVGIAGALNVGGDVVAYASSDKRLKDNIKNIQNPIEKVQKLNGVTWDWNSNADELQQSLPNVGVIAQEVEEVLPQLVHDRDNGYKGVDYAKLTGLLIEAIKEQQKQIEELKSKLG